MGERAVQAFWPLWTVIFLGIGAASLGFQDLVQVEIVWATLVCLAITFLGTLVYGVRRFKWPTRQNALDRLDATLAGRPIETLMDAQAIGAGDDASAAVWAVHRQRMAERAAAARAVQPDLRAASRDPYALRYVALMIFAIGVLFGSVWRVSSVADAALPGDTIAATGPVWEGWIEPPTYTGRPSIYLNDIDAGQVRAPQGSRITLRLYGEVGALTVTESVSGRTENLGSAADGVQSFDVTQSGALEISGPSGRAWDLVMVPDQAPSVRISAQIEAEANGEMKQAFIARDDYGVTRGTATVSLDLAAVERRYGLTIDPDPRAAFQLDLPMPISGDRTDFEEVLRDNLSEHPWANLPVIFKFQVEDDLGQTGESSDINVVLPGRRFFDPLAKAVIEQRRDLLWSRANAPRVAQILRAASHRPDEIFRSETSYLRLRVTLRRLETMARFGLKEDQQEEIAQALWDLAVQLEEGDLSDALERLRRAQERLSEATRNGASDEEIADLMQELREAMQDYMQQLAEQSDPSQQQGQQSAENMQTITEDQLDQMMDRIQELMEQGRMVEAQELLDQLQEMMENMQVAEGQQGQGSQSPGEQAMEGLADTLRDQQGLSDDAFRDLQEQFNPNAQAGENQGNEGRNGGEGRGQSHEGGQNGQGEGDGEQGQTGPQSGQSLADRQQALRQELGRQQRNLPGAGTPEGDAARDALDRAGRAMDGAEEALRQDDLAGAIDQQAEAMDALRDGLRNLGEALAQQQQNQGQQGQAMGNNADPEARDPLGREPGNGALTGTTEQFLEGEDVYGRARELLDEIRRRSGETSRSEGELDYLRRLLDRF
jgi:uncharacterized protein (TIGR02302 family)